MKIDFVKTLEASAPYIPGRIYFEESTSLIKVATASNQYRVFGGVRSADYDSSTDILTIQNGNGDEIYIDFSQYVKQDEYDDDQYVVSVALTELRNAVEELQAMIEQIPDAIEYYTNNFFDYAEYNSTDKTIDFYNDDTKLISIDATDFIKDGMVNDVSIHNGTGANANVSCLVVTFNTDASTEAIEIPVTKIFDSSSYYDTSTADNRFVRKVTSTDNAVARFDGTSGAIQNSGVTITDTNNIVTPGALYLTSIGSSVSNSTSRLYFGSTSSPYNYITANTSGVFGIYRASDSKGIACYPTENFFSNSNIDLGRSQSLWKNLYMSGTISDGTNTLTRPNKSGTIAITTDIPTDASVSAWGYTKNALTGVNFNGVDASVTNGVASILPIFDSEPTEDSSNFITSGAVYSTLADTEEVFAAAINDIQTNLSYMAEEMYNISDQTYGVIKTFQVNGVTQQKTGNNADTVNFILDDVPTQDSSYHGVSSAGLYNVITQNERVVAEVMNDLNDRLLAVEDMGVVDSSTVSSWGFTKNGLTGVSFNGVDASVTNGVAAIDASLGVEFIDLGIINPSGTTLPSGTYNRINQAVINGKTVILRTSDGEYYSDWHIFTGSEDDSISFYNENFNASFTVFSDDTTSDTYTYFIRYTHPAASITSTDITNWNNKVSNVQADWNATTGLSAILNKPTIPSTLDQIADGSTRKLSDYLPLAGGTMNVGASINILTALGNQGLSINSMGVEVYGPNDYSYIGQNMVTVTNQYDGVTELRPEALYVLSVSGADDYIGTWYNDGSICRKISSNTSYTYTFPNKTGILAVISDIPTDASVAAWGYIKSYTETDPTVPSWAKQANKPTYTASEVGALPASTVIPEEILVARYGEPLSQKVLSAFEVDLFDDSNDNPAVILRLADGKTATYYGEDAGAGYIFATAVWNGSSPRMYYYTYSGSTWHSFDVPLLSSYTETDPVFSASAASGITSTDITNWNNKVSNVQADWNATTGLGVILNKPTIPAAVTESTVSGWGFTKNTGTLTGVKFNNTNATVSNGVATITATIPAAPGTLKTNNTTAQTASASEALSGTINLHKVAKTGTYSDLIGLPTIPAAQVQSDWNATSGMGVILNKPSIPAAANNATITIQKGGTTVDSFTVNASSNKTINIPNELPTVTSSDNGKILRVVNGAWAADTTVTVYSGSNEPNNSTGINGDIYIQT